ncbi:Bacterial membrane flanked domain protein [compost metagenome]
MDETSFSISKDRIQAIEIEQSMMKRWLGLAEVKLISAGSLESNKNRHEINSLYPFLPIQRAYDMVSEILPSYQVTQGMTRLPPKALWLRVLRPSWFWMTVTAGLFYFKPMIFQMKEAWWVVAAILLMIVLVTRWLDFLNTRYTLHDRFIQIKTGSLTTTLFISKRDKIIEVKVTQSKLQKLLGLASIGTINRAKPVHHTGIKDVPSGLAESFYKWYIGRSTEITVK